MDVDIQKCRGNNLLNISLICHRNTKLHIKKYIIIKELNQELLKKEKDHKLRTSHRFVQRRKKLILQPGKSQKITKTLYILLVEIEKL
jgi:hypothetical protein